MGRDPVRLEAAERVLGGWTRPPSTGAEPALPAEAAAIRKAVAALDLEGLEAWGGLNEAIVRCAALELARLRLRPTRHVGLGIC